MRLYVDDWRSAPEGWRVARTVSEAVEILKTEPVEEISLDYVIGDSGEMNFSPVALFIVQMPKEKRPRRVSIHTSSPEGARHLRKILEGHIQEMRRG